MTPAESTRDKLISEAIKLMEQSGEAAVRVQKVADELNISEPAVYHHFKNRQELVTAAYMEWYRRSLVTGVRDDLTVLELNSRDEYEAALRATMEWSFQENRKEARKIRVSVIGAAQRNPELANAVNEVNRAFLETVEKATAIAQKRGWVRTDLDARAIAYWLNGQITGRIIAEMDPGHVDLAKWDEVSYSAVLSMLSGK